MEQIDRIFYKKINPSDFKKFYDIDKPTTGGGQTYLDAAGISNEMMVDFLSIAEKSDSPSDFRYTYTLKAYVLGKPNVQPKEIEFAPRKNRANYKISRQSMSHKHPAWDSSINDFPIPMTDSLTGQYTSNGNFVGIIDNLVIIIVRTTYCRYYASFINCSTMPSIWPTNIGLEDIFTGDRRGVINFDRYSVEFLNDFSNPFGKVIKIPLEYKTCLFSQNKEKRNRIFFGAPGTGKSYQLNEDRKRFPISDLNYERITFYADYSYAQFVGTYKPVTTGSGEISYKFVPGPFMRVLVKAYKNIFDSYDVSTNTFNTSKVKPYLLLIEEINRAHTSAVFGEVFQLLDRDDDGVSEYEIQPSEEIKEYLRENLGGTINDYYSIKLPDNMYIWATMNSADQGVFPMDSAFKRRWDFKYIGVDDEEFFVETNPSTSIITARECQGGTFNVAGVNIEWNVLRRAINSKLSSPIIRAHEDKLLGPFFLKTMDSTGNILVNDNEFIELFCNKVIMYLFEDAAKTKRLDMFSGCKDKGKINRFSYICEEFKNHGVAIFGDNFFENEYKLQLDERNVAKNEAER